MSVTVDDGALIEKDPSDIRVFAMDWDARNLAAGVNIASSAWALVVEREPTTGTTLTSDSPSILTGSRKTQIRLTAGRVGGRYTVTNTIVTNESPAQTKQRSFHVLIAEL